MSTKVAQKTASASKQKSKASHPTFREMILEVLRQLKDPQGVSRQVIRKQVDAKYSPRNCAVFLNKNLAKMIESGQLRHPKKYPGKYLINVVKAEKKPKKTPKKKVVKKPKTQAKPKAQAKPKTQAKSKKKPAATKKTKSPAKKQKVKATKKTPVKKAATKKAKTPASKKPAAKGKKGRGRQQKK